jgi:hypothetical protein
MAAVAPALLVFLANYLAVRNHFYVSGPYLLDAGWLSDLVYHNGVFPKNAAVLSRGREFFGDHLAPILSVGSLLSYLYPGDRVDWYCVFQGCIFAPLALVPALTVPRAARGSLEQALGVGAVALAFAFSGQVLSCAGYPHFEITVSAGVCVMLAALAAGRVPLAWVGLALAVSGREDGGFHAALLLAAVLACDLTKRPFPVPRRTTLTLLAVALTASIVGGVLQRRVFHGGSLFTIMYSGDPPYAHMRVPGVWSKRLTAFYETSQFVWWPFLLTGVIAAVKRDARYLLGWLVELPWLLLNFTSTQELKASFDIYTGFPFVMGAAWVGAYPAATRRADAKRAPLAGLAAVSVASTAGLWAAHPSAFLALIPAMLSPLPSNPTAIKSFSNTLRRDLGAYGPIAMDAGMVSWTIENEPRTRTVDPYTMAESAESSTFFWPGPLGPQVFDTIARGRHTRCGRIPRASVYFCTREGRPLPPEFEPRSLLVDSLLLAPGSERTPSGTLRLPRGERPEVRAFGPFARLSPGRYQATWDLTLIECAGGGDAPLLAVDAYVHPKVLGFLLVASAAQPVTLSFDLDVAATNLELRTWSGRCGAELRDLRLIKVDAQPASSPSP